MPMSYQQNESKTPPVTTSQEVILIEESIIKARTTIGSVVTVQILAKTLVMAVKKINNTRTV